MRLVEVVGGAQTDPAAVDAAIRTYEGWGKKPVRLNREIFGHIGNRLASALWREAVNLLLEGSHRWRISTRPSWKGRAEMGGFRPLRELPPVWWQGRDKPLPGELFRRHSAPMGRLGAPRLDEDTKDRIISLVEQGFSHAAIAEREARRGALLVAMMRALDPPDPPIPHAGAVTSPTPRARASARRIGNGPPSSRRCGTISARQRGSVRTFWCGLLILAARGRRVSTISSRPSPAMNNRSSSPT